MIVNGKIGKATGAVYVYSSPCKQHSKVLYRWGGQEKKKDSKTRKSRREEKVVVFSSASLFPVGKREAVTQGGTI